MLVSTQGNIWYLTAASGEYLDSVIAAGPEQAKLAVRHMLPGGGRWERAGAARYRYRR